MQAGIVEARSHPPNRLRASFWQLHGRRLAALWACSLIPYLNSFGDGLVHDNNPLILADSRVHAVTWANLHAILTGDYWIKVFNSGLYRPLTTLSYLFNYAVLGNGTHPAGYHLLNLLLQAINAGLVYLLGLALFEEVAPAFIMSILWTVHPVLTESVTNIVGRADQLAALGVLAGLLLHIRAGSAAGWRKIRSLAAFALVVGIGMFSKESAVVVLAAMVLYDLAFPAAGGWRARAWGYAAAAVPIALFLYARAPVSAAMSSNAVTVVDSPLVGADFWVARLTAVKVIGKYLCLYLWPAQLSADYSYNQIPVRIDWQGVLSLAVCCAAALAALVGLRHRGRLLSRALFFFIAFFFAALAPTSNLILPVAAIMAERFLYLPSIGLAGCLAMAILAACRRLAPARWRAAAAVVVTVAALACGARTYARNFDWLSEQTLWSATEISAPNNFKAHMSMARMYLDLPKADLDRAVNEAGRSLAIIADLPDSRSDAAPYAVAGEVYRRKGDSLPEGTERQQWYRKALDVLLHGQRIDLADSAADARANRARGIPVIAEGWEPLYLDLGYIYQRLGQWDKALAALRYGQSINLRPSFFEEMSHVYQQEGDHRQAEITLMEALVNDPSRTEFAARLTDLYSQSEPQSCALRQVGETKLLDLNCPLVHDQLCTAAHNLVILYAQSGKQDLGSTARTAVEQMGCPAGLFQ